jgi:hypothetical protein
MVVAALLVGSSAAATSPTAKACPTASLVDAALGQKALKAPVSSVYSTYAKTCTYRGYSDGGAPNGSMTVTFQTDTSATFAAGEKAAAAGIGAKTIKAVPKLGSAAWTTNLGSLYVFDGSEQIQIKILALLTPTSKLESLAKKLL